MRFATTEGTLGYSKRFNIPESHFRQTPVICGNLTLSSLGMGTYLGNIDDHIDNLVKEAVISSVKSGGVNVIDTAINYRYQRAERSVGRALEDLFTRTEIKRDEVFVSTKNGYIPGDGDRGINPRVFIQDLIRNGVVEAKEVVDGIHCMHPGFLTDQLGRSLNNLQLETIDLLYLHNAAESQIGRVGREKFMLRMRKAFQFLEEQRESKKIQFYGMATWNCFRVPETKKHEFLNLEDVANVAKTVGGEQHGFRFIQLPINLAMPEAFTEKWQTVNRMNVTLLEAASQLGIRAFASAPLLQTKLFSAKIPSYPGLETEAQRLLQFVRSIPSEALIGPLVGHKAPNHVKENLKLIQIPPFNKGNSKK
ncbi:MAG: aldo/keto reductase [Candidatus Hodarchaeota archaeon]